MFLQRALFQETTCSNNLKYVVNHVKKDHVTESRSSKKNEGVDLKRAIHITVQVRTCVVASSNWLGAISKGEDAM